MSNSTNGNQEITYAFVFGTVIAVGFPLNAVALWILLRRHSHKSPSAVFMVNLAISDLLLIISLPWRVHFYATGKSILGAMACNFIIMLFQNNIRSSSIFITFISVDRLLAVVYPLRSRHVRTASNAVKAAAFVWLVVVLINIPESMTLLNKLQNSTNFSCFDGNSSLTLSPILYFQPVLVLILLVINILSTFMVSVTVRKHLSTSAKVENRLNVMLIFAMNLMMFTIFFLPLSLVIMFEKVKNAITPLLCLASVNCCLDPLLYYFSFDGFWKKKEDVNSRE